MLLDYIALVIPEYPYNESEKEYPRVLSWNMFSVRLWIRCHNEKKLRKELQRRAKLQGETSPPFPTHYVEQAIVKGMLRSKYLRNEV